MTTRKTKQPVAVVCHDGKRCKGTHPLICRDHGCGILGWRAAAAESDSAHNERGKRSLERVDGRSCADAGHDYRGAVYVSRAKWVCPICQEDISFTYTLWWEAVHGADSPIEKLSD